MTTYRLEKGPGKSNGLWVVVEVRTGAWVRWFKSESRAVAYVAALNAGGAV
jgi:hypothetical protein